MDGSGMNSELIHILQMQNRILKKFEIECCKSKSTKNLQLLKLNQVSYFLVEADFLTPTNSEKKKELISACCCKEE